MSDTPSQPLRVGILFEYGTLSGGERSMLAVLDRLSSQSLQPVTFAIPGSSLAEELATRALRLETLPAPSPEREPRGMAWAEDLNRLGRECQIDLWHANSLAMGRVLGEAAPYLDLPATAHLRDIVKLSRSAATSLNQLTGMVAVSEATRQFHVAQGIDAERVEVIHNGIDQQTWQPREKRGWLSRELNLPKEMQLAATVGQISLRKGQVDLALAAAELRDILPDLHFLVIGERYSQKEESVAEEERMIALFQNAGMSQRLHCLGFRNDLPELFPELDLLIHPARQEPFGRVLLEAAACGLPIVATDVGGTGELLQHDVSAWLVPPRSPGELARGVHRLLTDHPLRMRLAHGARRAAESIGSIDVAADRLLKFWQRQVNPTQL